MLKTIIKKLLGQQDLLRKYQPYLSKANSSVLLPGSAFDFRTNIENRKYVIIGEKCIIKAVFTFETASGCVKIGNNTHLGGIHFICKSAIEIGNDVTMAWGIIFYDHDSHSTEWEYRKNDNIQCYEDYQSHSGNSIANKDWSHVISKPIIVKDKVWIGFDVTILKGVVIGEGAVIGAKSVVTKDVPAWTIVAGNPARVVKQLKEPEKI
jgi:acetyltransferase-like isoleucine patch superfamily enzyme